MEHQPIKVLLVEDDPGDARLVAEMLKAGGGMGFELSRAIRLADGLQLLDSRHYDVAPLDLTLPDSPGLLTLLKFTGHARNKKVPVIVLTGMDSTMAGSWPVQEGAIDYLVKASRCRSAGVLDSFSHRTVAKPSGQQPAQEVAGATKGSDVV